MQENEPKDEKMVPNEVTVPLVPFPDNTAEAQDRGHSNFTSFGNNSPAEHSTSYGTEDEEEEFLPRQRRNPFLNLFRRGHDVESARVNHYYTREERERLSNVESIDYLPPNSAVYRQWLASQPYRRLWDRWFMMGSIGLTVGLVGYLLFTLISAFVTAKYRTTDWLLAHTGLFLAWAFNLLFSCALVFVSTWTVVNIAPAASGAGVAEIMAYLNGCHMPKVFNMRTLFVKFISCATAVGSGLPVGPEGPMIHIGAMLGSALSQGHSTTLGCSTGLFTRFRNPRDKRDFVTAGVGVGVATAFSAPIGGLLFAFEEVASFFSQSLFWQIFFACMVSVLTLDTSRSAQRALTQGQFGLFEGDASTVFFEVQTVLQNHAAAVLPAAVIGLACGLLGIAFTILNLKITRIRDVVVGDDPKRRMAEPIILIALFVTVGMILPLFFPCTATECIIEQGDTKPFCPNGTSTHIQRIVEEQTEVYTCPQKPYNATSGGESRIVQRQYNELATLMAVPGDDAIRHLLTRGTHREFGYAALCVMLAFYFVGAAWAAGSAISSGVFVPMLLMGSIIGRIVGLAAVDLTAALGHGSEGVPPGVFAPPHPYSWIDPGVFALIGAGAFMGAVTRLTVALAVIMMEMSNDVRMLLPLLVAIMVAKWVADAATHSLYHAQLEVKCVPFLQEDPVSKKDLDLVPVSNIMAYPVTVFKERMRVREVRDALRDTAHNGFPVVRDTPAGQVFVGLVLRDHLLVLLTTAFARGTAQHIDLSYSQLNRRYVSPAAQRMVSEQQLAVLQGSAAINGLDDGESPVIDEVLDLGPYINSSCVAVAESFSLERAYILFRTMGLRHLVVVDAHNRVKGMLTRKDLLGFRLDEAVDHARLSGHLQHQSRVPTHELL